MERAAEIAVRRARSEDRAAIVELCRETLRWDPAAPNEEFFSWKHDGNPFGPSPMWIALDGDQIVGLRAFLRWRFVNSTGRTAEAVRAVDTATHPSAQGKGIFTRLTMSALTEMAEEGVDFVFNTPNARSQPGYMKMGWSVVGRTSLAIHARTPLTLTKLLRSRTRAEKFSQITTAGRDPLEIFGEHNGHVPQTQARPRGWSTDQTADYLRWRYSFGPLHYRLQMAGPTLSDGAAVFRLHRRGDAMEATVVDTFGTRLPMGFWRRLLHDTDADYVIRAAPDARSLTEWFVPLPRTGPVLTQRYLDPNKIGTTDDFHLTLSDVELF